MYWTLVKAVRFQFKYQKPTKKKTDAKTVGSKGDGMSFTNSSIVSGFKLCIVEKQEKNVELKLKSSD